MNSNMYIRNFNFFKFIFILFAFMAINSCTDEFDKYNSNKNTLTEVGTKQLQQLFSNAVFRGNNMLTTDNYIRFSTSLANHQCGYTVTSNNSGANEQNFLNESWLYRGFSKFYDLSLPSLKAILDITGDDETLSSEHNVAMVYQVFCFQQLTDFWGPVPYTEAINADIAVPYESQKDVYYEMFDDLQTAIAELQKNPGGNAFDAADVMYNGDVSKWIKFANTLRLRMAIRISNVDPDKAKLEAEAAVAGGTLETNDDNAFCDVTTWDDGNGMPRANGYDLDRMSTTMASFMNGYNDPRISEYWSPVVHNTAMDVGGYPQELLDHIGGYYGTTRGFETGELPYYFAASKPGPRFTSGLQTVTPINVMHSAEAMFLKAEGAWRGWNMGGSAQSFYEKGIELSIKQWRGNSFPDAEINAYINNTATPVAADNYPYYDQPTTDIPVRFSSDSEKQYEQIITQKWLALFPISIEAWAEYRRTRLPKLHPKKNSVNGNIDVSKGQIITRLPFVAEEKQTQPDEVAKAEQLLKGPDLESTPLWWDVNPN